MKLKVFRLRETAKLPVRAYPTDAGMDLFYCPSDEKNNNFNKNNEIRIGPGSGSIIPTGLKIGVPEGYMLEIKNKSGVATKQRLVVGACVVDSGYDGEIFVNLNNIGNSVKEITPGQRSHKLFWSPLRLVGLKKSSKIMSMERLP